jgi:hypothetical protein
MTLPDGTRLVALAATAQIELDLPPVGFALGLERNGRPAGDDLQGGTA